MDGSNGLRSRAAGDLEKVYLYIYGIVQLDICFIVYVPFPDAFWKFMMSFMISYHTFSECTTKNNPK